MQKTIKLMKSNSFFKKKCKKKKTFRGNFPVDHRNKRWNQKTVG